ncbi:MAG: glycosyltransferase, partial [Candidatus Pacearchaeota archaeon]
ELRNYLVNLSKKLGLKTYLWNKDKISENFDVYFLGSQKNPFKFIIKSKLFLFTSLWEGFPNAILEAMACGVPAISSDCKSGPREILAPDTNFEFQTKEPEFAKYGILMPVFDGKFKKENQPLDEVEKMWIKTIKEILENEKLRKEYSEKAIERAKDFSVEKILPQWEAILQS